MDYRILGPLEVAGDGGALPLGGERQRALLGLLLIHANEVVSVDRIIDSLWPEAPPETAGNVIQVYVSRLRKVLDPERPTGVDSTVLLTRRPGYLLRVADRDLDAARFERAADEGRRALEDGAPGVAAATLRRGLSLWRGDALADLAYEEFAASAAARLDEARIAATEHLIEARLALGEHDDAVADLERLVTLHPLRERLWIHLVTALYRSGRQADALRAYRRAADTLVEQLGLDPSPKLRELEDRILVQDPTLDYVPPTRSNTEQPLIGRADHVAALSDAADMVARGRRVAIELVGAEGTGVSRLLEEAARLAGQAGLETRQIVAHPATVTTPGEVSDQVIEPSGPWALVLGGAQWTDPTSMGAIRRWLTDGDFPLLLVVGHEPITGRAAQPLRSLLGAADSVGFVVPLTVDRVTRADLERVAEPDLASWLYQRTAGEPYALGRLLDHLRDRGIVSWDSGMLETTGTLPTEVMASPIEKVASLGKAARHVVESVAVAGHPVPFDVICELVGMDTHDTLEMIDGLVADALLEESAAGVSAGPGIQSGRLTSTFGATRTQTVARSLAEAWMACGHRDGDRAAVGRLAALANDDVTAARLLGDAGLEAAGQQHLGEAQPLLEGAIDALRRLGEVGGPRWGELHLALAECHRLAGWPTDAAAALDEAIDHTTGEARIDARGWAAQIASDQQDPVAAEWHVAVGEWEAARIDARAKLGSLLSLRARVLNRLAFADEADLAYAKAQAMLDRWGGERQRYLAGYNRAWISFDRGEAAEAEAAFGRLLTKIPDEDDARRADLLAWRGRALYRTGRVDEAADAAAAARRAGLRQGDVGPVFLSHMADAEGALLYGAYDDALVSANEMLGLVLQQLPEWENAARLLVARAHLGRGDIDLARHEAANATELCLPGPGGRRWWYICRVGEMAVETAAGAELAPDHQPILEALRRARWLEPAIELLLLRARAGNPGDAEQAMDLAVGAGLASHAARAAGLCEGPRRIQAERLANRAFGTLPVTWQRSFMDMVGGVIQPNR